MAHDHPAKPAKARSEEVEAPSGEALTPRAWYRLLNEDWWALILGLILVILLVTRILHSIP
jgi:hypothetical protein